MLSIQITEFKFRRHQVRVVAPIPKFTYCTVYIRKPMVWCIHLRVMLVYAWTPLQVLWWGMCCFPRGPVLTRQSMTSSHGGWVKRLVVPYTVESDDHVGLAVNKFRGLVHDIGITSTLVWRYGAVHCAMSMHVQKKCWLKVLCHDINARKRWLLLNLNLVYGEPRTNVVINHAHTILVLPWILCTGKARPSYMALQDLTNSFCLLLELLLIGTAALCLRTKSKYQTSVHGS